MPDLETLFSAYEAELLGTSYDVSDHRMDATFRLVMRGDKFDEPLHDRLIEGHDGIDGADWRIDALDTDHDNDWAMCTMLIEARTLSTCRTLQPFVVRALPDFK